VRTEATIGGNVISALPYRNLLPTLLASGATLELTSATGSRTVPFDGFITAPGRTRLAEGELLTAVRLPEHRGFADYTKVGRRNAQFVATVSAAIVSRDGAARLAFGNAGPTPLRSDDVDAVATALLDGQASAADLQAAVAAAVDPPEDTVASADYRRHALGVLAVRLVSRAAVDGGLGS
jgi:CO/xanthine dehydrogenase FAD-binding subunit